MIDEIDPRVRIRPHSSNCAASKSDVLSPSIIRYMQFQQNELARQVLIFENHPSKNATSRGRGTGLVELIDGRVFFFRTSLEAIKDGDPMHILLSELSQLPVWITNWKSASEKVAYVVGAQFEFLESEPNVIESWDVSGWRRHAASWLAIHRSTSSIQQIGAIATEVAEELSSELLGRVKSFLNLLDKFATSIHGQHHCSWQSAYNFFTPLSDTNRLYRRQAEKSFPMVVQQLFLDPGNPITFSLIQAIDEGIPLIEFIAKIFACPQKCVRHLNGLRFEDIGTQWEGRIRELLMILASLDMNRFPKNSHEWSVFGETVELLSSMTKMPTSALSSRLLLGEFSKQRWGRKINADLGYEERALAIERFSENVRQAIITSAWVNGKNVSRSGGNALSLATEATCSLGITRLEKLSKIWRDEELKLDSKSLSHDRDSFPALMDEPIVVGELKIVQLMNSSQLSAEGNRMSNCVASYAGQCASGKAFIFSVRTLDGKSCVTVEFSLSHSTSGWPELNLVQQKGKNNESPNSQYYGALNVLHRFAKSPEIRKKLLDLLNYQRVAEKGGADMATKYLRSLEFMDFLKREVGNRIDIDRLVNEVSI